jgi:hypothetical protein
MPRILGQPHQSREMASFRDDGVVLPGRRNRRRPDDVDWLVEKLAYYAILHGKIAWMIVPFGGYQPMTTIPTAQIRPETPARQIVL